MWGALNNALTMWYYWLMYYLAMYSQQMSPLQTSGNQYNQYAQTVQANTSPETIVLSYAPDLGNQLVRTFPEFIPQPVTFQAAVQSGWIPYPNTCNPTLGYTLVRPASEANPSSLLFTQAGQLAGFGVRIWGNVPAPLVEAGYLLPVQGQPYAHDIYVVTRSSKLLCSGNSAPEIVGDRVLINGRYPVQLNTTAATSNGWMSGMCMPEMGIHYSTDIYTPGQNTWNPDTLNPVIALYDAQTGHINGVLINTWNWQSSEEPTGVWEQGITTPMFCMNWCANSGCHFNGVAHWNTFHWYFRDPSQISCAGAPCQLSDYKM